VQGVHRAEELEQLAASKPTKKQLKALEPKMQFMFKHRGVRTKWQAPSDFPSRMVMQAYRKPSVNSSAADFHWSLPNVQALESLCAVSCPDCCHLMHHALISLQNAFGWNKAESSVHLHKVMAELTKGDTQTTLHQFYVMKYEDGVRAAGVRSKRMKHALKRIHKVSDALPGDSSSASQAEARTKRTASRGQKRSRSKPSAEVKPASSTTDSIADDALLNIDVAAAVARGTDEGDAASSADFQQPECLSSESDRGSSTDEDLKIPRRLPRRRRKQARL